MFSVNNSKKPSRIWPTLIFLLVFPPVALEILPRFNTPNKQHVALELIHNAGAASARQQSAAATRQPAPEAIAKNLALAWNRGDSDAVARFFLPDGVLVIPTGSIIRSRSEIRKKILDERNGRLKGSKLSNTVEDVALIDVSTALVNGKFGVDGMKVLGVSTSPAGTYVLRQKKQKGAWLIEKAEVLGK